jgi:glycosyltransferase involved in cell wall biosynthesis
MASAPPPFGAVVIGRNEGERLKRCLKSLSRAVTIYVDSGSTDGSVQSAREHGAQVIELDRQRPFTAARARNAGFHKVTSAAPELAYVQFVDGDCEVVDGWTRTAASFLEQHSDIAAVCGRRRERFPTQSVYNWLCDREWAGPPGEARVFGGDVMVRAAALQAVGGYRDDMIAGEDPELAFRLRSSGWRIWRLADEMTLHDAAMTRFSQWWKRSMRAGYAYALGAHLHGAAAERYFVWEWRRAWLWGLWLPVACLATGLLLPPWGWAAWLVYPAQILRQTIRHGGSLKERVTVAAFQTLARFAEALGQIRFLRDRLFGSPTQIIEYK